MPVRINMSLTQSVADDRYVKKAGDTMTGKLTIDPSVDELSFSAKKDMELKTAEKMYLDGQ